MERISLSEYLRQAISEYLKKKSHSLITLSDKSGIHYNTLARILKGRVEQPSMETTLGILKICETKQNIGPTLARFFPDYNVVLDLPTETQESLVDVNVERLNIFSDPLCVRIIFSITSGHTNYTGELRKEFGELGVSCLNRLIASGIVLCEEEKLALNREVVEALDEQSILELLQSSVGLLLSCKQDALINLEMRGLNDAGLDLVSQHLDEAHEKIRKILEDKSFSGSNPVLMTTFCGVVDEFRGSDSTRWLM